MYIESIELKDFRNYDYLSLDLDEKVNLLYGDNAQGKTNILEAMCIASTARSHRGAKDEELIRIPGLTVQDMIRQSQYTDFVEDKHTESVKDSGTDPSQDNFTDSVKVKSTDHAGFFNNYKLEDAHIKLIVKKEFSRDRIDIHLKKNRTKGIALNGIPVKRAADIFGILQIVFFSPEDLDIIRRGPGVRRHFLDMDISRINSLYLNQLLGYNKVLESRNKLLKKISFARKEGDINTLDILDEQLILLGNEVISERIKYIRKLNILISSIHSSISGKREEAEIIYEPHATIETFAQELKKCREKDIKTGQTNVGPHRDDFTFSINGADVKRYGSQGQKRTAALSLKLAQIDIAKSMTGELPVLLLDDVLSELDFNRQKFLLERIGNMQTIITCTGRDSLIKQEFSVDRIFKVSEGKVSLES